MREMAGVTAAILAGGMGTRLRSVVSDRPKVLAEVAGRPFLGFLLDQLAAAGVGRAVLCTGYLGENVCTEFGESYGNLHLQYSRESSPLGTGGGLRLALPLFESDFVLVMNGDSYCDVDLSAFWAWHYDRHGSASMVLAEVPDTARYGSVCTDDDGQILSFEEKGGREGPGWINAGIYLLARRLVMTIPVGRSVSLEREAFPGWVGRGLYGYRSDGRFLDIGTPESYATAEQVLTQGALT